MPEVYSFLLDVLPVPAAFLTLDGACIDVNARMKDCLGAASLACVSGAEFAGSVFDRESATRLQNALTASRAGAPIDLEGAFISKTGTSLTGHVSLLPIAFEGDKAPALLLRFGVGESESVSFDRPSEIDLGAIQGRFPDELVELPGSMALGDIRTKLEAAVGCGIDASLLAEHVSICRQGRASVFYVRNHCAASGAQDADMVGRGCADTADCSEVRLVRMPEGSAAQPSILAIIRSRMACPQEAAEYKRLALTDAVTNMPNRRAVYREVERLLKHSDVQGGDGGFAIFCIDLDDFKKINDLAGHGAGDEMLRRVGSVLKTVLGTYGMAGRLGGDEFGGVARVESSAHAETVANAMREALARLHLSDNGRIFTTSGSIGVCFVRSQIAGHADIDELFHRADMASMNGKRSGGGTVVATEFHAETKSAAILTQTSGDANEQVCRIEDAELLGSPVYSLAEAKPLGVRAAFAAGGGDIANWLGRVSDRSVANARSLHAQLDCWALDQVLDFLRSHRSCKWGSVHLKAVAFDDKAMRDLMTMRLVNDPLLAGRLCIEITERDYLCEPGRASAFLSFAAGLGCQTAIGDFSGHLPVFEGLADSRVGWIRLRPSVTQLATSNRKKRGILKGLLCAARELGIRTLAQDVGATSDMILMSSLDIDAVEGPYVGEPMLLSEMGF